MSDPRFDAHIWTSFEYGGSRAEGLIENAGKGGVFIQTSTIPERGQKIWLTFEGPAGEVVEAIGIVWWTTQEVVLPREHRDGFGVRLVARSRTYHEIIRELSDRCPDPDALPSA